MISMKTYKDNKKIKKSNSLQNKNLKNLRILNHKIRRNSNFWSLKSLDKMTTMSNFTSSKNKNSKFNMKTNMMILLIMTNDHFLWTLLRVTLNQSKKWNCKDWFQIKTIKKLIKWNILNLKKNKRRKNNKINILKLHINRSWNLLKSKKLNKNHKKMMEKSNISLNKKIEKPKSQQ